MDRLVGHVAAVSRYRRHRFSKTPELLVRLIEGIGIEGDAHAGRTVQHRYDARKDPSRPNLRQVHFIEAEELDRLGRAGFTVEPGSLGENITTRGLDLPVLPSGALLRLGETAVVAVTGLRDPCVLLDRVQPGLKAALLGRDPHGRLLRRSGIMSIVLAGGDVRPGDPIRVDLPPRPHRPLTVV